MTSICLYFEVHQPMRLNHFSIFNIGANQDRFSDYFNDKLNQEIFEKVAKKCYLPTNKILLELINKYDGKLRVSFSLTGTFIEYCERYMPSVLDSFKDLFATGAVDLIEETYYHSLSSLYDELDEFEDQVSRKFSALCPVGAGGTRGRFLRNAPPPTKPLHAACGTSTPVAAGRA